MIVWNYVIAIIILVLLVAFAIFGLWWNATYVGHTGTTGMTGRTGCTGTGSTGGTVIILDDLPPDQYQAAILERREQIRDRIRRRNKPPDPPP
jgi:hypothetical protein